MLLILSLFACTDPEAIAVSACQAVPTLSADPSGAVLLESLLDPEEYAVLQAAEPTLGMAKVGAEGMAALRAGTSCESDGVEGAGSGAWAVTLTRTAPSVNADGTLGEPTETEFTWQVVSKEGGRVQPGLPKAEAMRKSIAAAAAQGDWRRFAATHRTLAGAFPDPTFAVDVAAAEQREARMDYRKMLVAAFEGAGEGMVLGRLENSGDKVLSEVTIKATFQVSGQPFDKEVILPAAGVGSTEFKVPIPDGAEGSVVLEPVDWEFAG